MSEQATFENMKKLNDICLKAPIVFHMAISHLFENGTRAFTEASVEATRKHLEEKHANAEARGETLLMTQAMEETIVDTAFRIGQFPLFDILLYIKRQMNLYDPQSVLLTNIYTNAVVGEIDGNIVRTDMGSYEVGERELEWLINVASSKRDFSAYDVRAVGELIVED